MEMTPGSRARAVFTRAYWCLQSISMKYWHRAAARVDEGEGGRVVVVLDAPPRNSARRATPPGIEPGSRAEHGLSIS